MPLKLQKVKDFKKLMFVRIEPEGEILISQHSLGIKDLRKFLNFTTAQFGEKIGVSHRTIEGWEYGKGKEPSRSNLMLIKAVFKL